MLGEVFVQAPPDDGGAAGGQEAGTSQLHPNPLRQQRWRLLELVISAGELEESQDPGDSCFVREVSMSNHILRAGTFCSSGFRSMFRGYCTYRCGRGQILRVFVLTLAEAQQLISRLEATQDSDGFNLRCRLLYQD